jgi:predicted alpha/beta-hydrolase family hydrolase
MPMTERGSIIPFERPAVHGFLHQPDDAGARPNGLVLTHGAGSNCNAPLLIRAASAFSAAGFWVLRCDLEFRRRRPSGPPSPSTSAVDRAGLKSAMAAMRDIASGQQFLGGHSYGGRQATVLASDEPDLAHGLLLFSYPLHPPKKQSQGRTEHFPRLRVPSVFVHGTDDPFGSLDELGSALALIPAPTKLIAIEGARHDLKRGNFDLQSIVAALLEQACD